MIWQDIVVSIGSVAFSVALIPAMRSREKPPVFTSWFTTLILGGFVTVHVSYELWFGATFQTLLALQWFYVGWQRAKINKERKERFWAL